MHVTLNDRGAALITLGENPNGPELVTTEKVVNIGVEQHSNKLLFRLDPNNENILTNKVVGGSIHGCTIPKRCHRHPTDMTGMHAGHIRRMAVATLRYGAAMNTATNNLVCKNILIVGIEPEKQLV